MFDTPSGGMPCDINVIDTLLKSRCNRLQLRRRQYGSIFIRVAVVGSQRCEIPRYSVKIRSYSRSSSSKVIDLVVNRKRIYDFGLGPVRYMTISVHTTSVQVFRQIRNLDHFGTCTTSVHWPLRYELVLNRFDLHLYNILLLVVYIQWWPKLI